MRDFLPSRFLASCCVVFVAGCGHSVDPSALRHPTLGPDEQARIRGRCEAEAHAGLGPAPKPAPTRPCPEDGDPLARDRCRTDADLALIAQTRYIGRVDALTVECLRKAGFRE